MAASTVLLLTTLIIRDTHSLHNDGILGTIECVMWNIKFMLWGLFASSTWNIVALTFER